MIASMVWHNDTVTWAAKRLMGKGGGVVHPSVGPENDRAIDIHSMHDDSSRYEDWDMTQVFHLTHFTTQHQTVTQSDIDHYKFKASPHMFH